MSKHHFSGGGRPATPDPRPARTFRHPFRPLRSRKGRPWQAIPGPGTSRETAGRSPGKATGAGLPPSPSSSRSRSSSPHLRPSQAGPARRRHPLFLSRPASLISPALPLTPFRQHPPLDSHSHRHHPCITSSLLRYNPPRASFLLRHRPLCSAPLASSALIPFSPLLRAPARPPETRLY